MICKYCGKNISNKGIKMHENACKNITIKIKNNIISDYKNGLSLKKLNEKYLISIHMIINILGNLKRTHIESSRLIHKLYPEKFKHSKETRDKLRKIRIEFLKNHPEQNHWRRVHLSYPEKCFLNLLNNEKISEKYNIIREYSVFPYYIDFAFPDIKLAIEIDGSQHLREEYKSNDIKKDKFLTLKKWKVVRIEAKAIMYEYENVKEKLLNILNTYQNINNIKINHEIKTHHELKMIELNKKKGLKKIEKQKNIQNRINIILTSNVDFSKFGWVNKIALLLNIKSQKVSAWMKKYMNEFYEKNCFKKKIMICPHRLKVRIRDFQSLDARSITG